MSRLKTYLAVTAAWIWVKFMPRNPISSIGTRQFHAAGLADQHQEIEATEPQGQNPQEIESQDIGESKSFWCPSNIGSCIIAMWCPLQLARGREEMVRSVLSLCCKTQLVLLIIASRISVIHDNNEELAFFTNKAGILANLSFLLSSVFTDTMQVSSCTCHRQLLIYVNLTLYFLFK